MLVKNEIAKNEVSFVKIKKFDHVNIVTKDIKKCIEFYTEVFGFVVKLNTSLNGEWFNSLTFGEDSDATCCFLELTDSSFRIEVLEYKNPKSVLEEEDHNLNTIGLRHMAFEVDDIDGFIEKLEKNGAKRISEIVQVPLSILPTGKRLCYIKAPDDVIIELAQYGT